jgi:DNA-binding MarR family transcriptional regulator
MTQPPPDVPAAAGGGPLSHAIFRVARLHRALAGQLLRSAGLYPGQELVMMHLWDDGPRRQIDLARVIGSDAATMTRMVRRLEQAGFVRRRACASDARVVMVEPTAASHALREQVEDIWRRLEELTVRGLSESEQDDALRLLRRLEAGLSATNHDCESRA